MKKRIRLFALLALVPILAAAATWAGRYTVDRRVALPILSFPATIDLGNRERGDVAVGRFIIANRGTTKLLVDQFSTSCSCAGVEREVGGRWQRVESVEIPPNGQFELAVRVSVGVPEGERQVVDIGFSSNDPKRPNGKIQVMIPLVKGGVYALPRVVIFGEIRCGGSESRVIDLYDNRQPGRRIEKVRSLQPERFGVRLLAVDAQQLGQIHDRGGRRIARVEIIAPASRPGPLNGLIEVSLASEERRPDVIPVFGEVVQDVECRPSTLILPRRAGERFTYSGQILLRQRDGQSIQVEVASVPSGISAKVRSVRDAEFPWLLEVDCARPQPALLGEKIITLRVRSGKVESVLNVPVLLTIDPSAESQGTD